MAARTPEEAVDAFLDPLRRAALCLTNQPLLASGYRPAREPHSVTFAPRGRAVQLRSRSGLLGVNLFLGHRYEITGTSNPNRAPWTVHSVAYVYEVLDRDGRELLTYHWHPNAAGPGFPHLHVPGRVGVLPLGEGLPPVALGGMHLPTDRIAFGAVVRLLITEFDIAPQRDDWEHVVSDGEAALHASRNRLG